MDEIYLSREDWETLAYHGVAGRRKEDRRFVRNQLGTSSDPAPTAQQALKAADTLSSMLSLATAGEFTLVVKRSNGQTYKPLEAWRYLRDLLKLRRRAALAPRQS